MEKKKSRPSAVAKKFIWVGGGKLNDHSHSITLKKPPSDMLILVCVVFSILMVLPSYDPCLRCREFTLS